ncbi:selenide-water dikinase [Fusibacter sp. 3D3]|nr:selenide-water dikinase [Fusibacter sp. 3D3]
MCDLPKFEDEALLVGFDTSDDAAVYKINDELAMIQTLDFFTPIVNDPYDFGQIAAANALSDVYAMGGKPTLAMNIVGFPNCLSPEILKKILKGGADKVKEAGAILVGGHSIEDNEPKYGLSCTGMVHPDRIWRNFGAIPGDVLILTKPLGIGVIATALKADLLRQETVEKAIFNMSELNKYAKEAIESFSVHACTDITGFGLLGHALEMAKGSHVTIEIETSKLEFIEESKEMAAMGIIPAGAYKNKFFIQKDASFDQNVEEVIIDLICDPQTSGGLLFSIPQDEMSAVLASLERHVKTAYFIVGKVLKKEKHFLKVK